MKTPPKIATQITLFPHVLLRIAGNPTETIGQLVGDMSVSNNIISSEGKLAILQKRKEVFCEKLLCYIQGIDEQPKTQQLLQNLRRDIFNDRNVKAKDFDFALSNLSDELIQQLEDLLTLKKQIFEEEENTKILYAESLYFSRTQLQKLIKDDMFLKGISFSSLILKEQITNYLNTEVKDFRKKELQIEGGILRYYTRMSMKTSPYSTFTHLSFAKLPDTDGVSFDNQLLGTPQSSISLNIRLLKCFQGLILRSQTLKYFQLLTVNPSVTVVDGKFKFAVQQSDSVRCGSLPFSSTIQFILEIVSERKSYQQTVLKILRKFNSDEITIIKYLDKLLEMGLINLTFPIEAYDVQWSHQLLKWLQTHAWIKPAFIHPQIIFLQTLIDIEAKIAQADETERAKLLTAYQKSLSLFEQQETIKPFIDEFLKIKPEQVFFEDVFLPNSSITLPQSDLLVIAKWIEDLSKYVATHFPHPLNVLFNDIWEHLTNELNDEVPLIKFFEAYLLQKESATGQNTISLSESLLEIWEQLVDNHEIININTSDLIYTQMPISEQNTLSKSIFIQYFKNEQGQLSGVLNGILEGCGRMYSRFLKGFDTEITHQLQLWNKSVSEDLLLAENSDDTFHNANIHEPLLPCQLINPAGHPLQGKVNKIPVSELTIKKIDSTLRIFHPKSQQIVVVFDMGFQAKRSVLYEFVNQFSTFKHPKLGEFCKMLNTIASKKFRATQAYYYLPRIQISDRLIIQRKTWILPFQWHTEQLMDTEGFEFYKILQRIKDELNLPSEVFVNIDGVNSDDRKPQYIHLDNPLLVEMLRKIYLKAKKTLSAIRIVEMQPQSSQLYPINNQHYVCEAVPQWYLNTF
ncbi:MAG: lantibiotic dehydratase [Arcicella sp.]|nr:lantibiotic dehydratase [Arcicella sp.]